MQVRYEMARALCVPVTEHTYGDLMLSVNAQQLRLVRDFVLLFFSLSTRASYMDCLLFLDHSTSSTALWTILCNCWFCAAITSELHGGNGKNREGESRGFSCRCCSSPLSVPIWFVLCRAERVVSWSCSKRSVLDGYFWWLAGTWLDGRRREDSSGEVRHLES